MLQVEIKKKTQKKSISEKFLVINGVADEDSYFSEDEVPYSYSHFYDDDVIDIFRKYSFKEIGEIFTNIGFGVKQEWWDDLIDIDVYCNTHYETKIPCIKVNLQIQHWEHWAKPWSISTLANQFEINVVALGYENINYWQEDEESVLNGFGLEYFPADDALIIENDLSYILNITEKLVNDTNKLLFSSLDSEAVLTYFQFPDEVKTACKQYLIYFTQFIADMGIAVDTEIKEELNHTLFKIIPKSKNESLEKIREALNIYLNAPSDKSFQLELSTQSDIAAKQWEANVYHLKSQLSLATSIIQAKESTIEMLQISNYQYRQMLESHTQKKESDKEDIIKGIVAVKKYEGKGFTIDFAEIFRRLKRIIK